MAKQPRLELEVSRWERRQWKVQRVAWTLLGLVLLAGATGLLGGGGLSRLTASSPGGDYTVSYERVQRLHAARPVSWHAAPRDGHLIVEIATPDCMHVSSDGVAPESTKVTAAGQRYVFSVSTAERATATFTVQPQRVGSCVMRGRANDAEWVRLPMFVLP